MSSQQEGYPASAILGVPSGDSWQLSSKLSQGSITLQFPDGQTSNLNLDTVVLYEMYYPDSVVALTAVDAITKESVVVFSRQPRGFASGNCS